MTTDRDTRVVLLTPEGRGAVASVLVVGPSAIADVGALFHGTRAIAFAAQPLQKILFGRWGSELTGEEVVVCRRGQDRVEIHCHGGQAAARAIIESLTARGCQAVERRAWTRQSVDRPIAAAAAIALADATTERAAATLWHQRDGALDRALGEVAASIDRGQIHTAKEQVDALLERAPLGMHLIKPWRVVLAGRPNVGKSSLINALCGYERAIVHSTPGTTRDVVTAETAIDGWPIELSDTAGLHATRDALESAGIRLAHERMTTADLVVLVFDASGPWTAEDGSLTDRWLKALVVHNKCDLVRPADRTRNAGLYISAASGEAIDVLEREIARRLVPRPPEPGQAVPFLAAQVRALEKIGQALAASDPGLARALVAEVEQAATTTC